MCRMQIWLGFSQNQYVIIYPLYIIYYIYCIFSNVYNTIPERSCLMRPLLLFISTGRKSLNQEISGSGLPLAAHSMVAVRVFSTTLSWGSMSMVGKPWGIWFSGKQKGRHSLSPPTNQALFQNMYDTVIPRTMWDMVKEQQSIERPCKFLYPVY